MNRASLPLLLASLLGVGAGACGSSGSASSGSGAFVGQEPRSVPSRTITGA